MKIIIITLFPEYFDVFQHLGVIGRAIQAGRVDLQLINPRDFTEDVHRTVDDRPFGGGPGMVMLAEPLAQAIEAAKAQMPSANVVYLSPQGEVFQQSVANAMAHEVEELILLCGRYEGIDERVLDCLVDHEISLGDFVVSGGEVPAMMLLDAVIRLLPGVLGHQDSAVQDSFMHGLLDCPQYTRPSLWRGQAVPEILLSGDHQKIQQWRAEQAQLATLKKRKDLLQSD